MTRRRGGVVSGWDDLHESVGEASPVDGVEAVKAVSAARSGQTRAVPLRELTGNPRNPRDSVGDLEELASIVDHQLQPAVAVSREAFVKLYPESEITTRWVVIIGNRRLAAAHKFGRPNLDIVVKDELAKDKATLLSAVIAENVDRSGFDVIEEAKAVQQLVDELGSGDAAAEQMKKSKTWVSQRRDLLKLDPELQEATRRSDLAIRDARALARLPRAEQVAKWHSVIAQRSSDRKPGAGEGSGGSAGAAGEQSGSSNARGISRALKKFDTEPAALALALRDQLGDAGVKTLVSTLRKLAK
ncbi:ParB/RepB/Spo0J family partition protein [Mycobacteroides abscessus]|uniref:ParB/RepB/Spo0J family partition protein n=1 Tax=Mycobacteroides abscessus TaxID=36809 RepID=UPI0009A5A058|nr:ParB/RepB/Spo0J family partition protein [Mycobacteroides abscessus]SLC86486.1 putative transcriptional regulator [Mycobacteroides abscessus subsp. abscessus]SLG74897.1 putative transcriptional regulator [Mycobacteroides abscessus subsp. abscessus]